MEKFDKACPKRQDEAIRIGSDKLCRRKNTCERKSKQFIFFIIRQDEEISEQRRNVGRTREHATYRNVTYNLLKVLQNASPTVNEKYFYKLKIIRNDYKKNIELTKQQQQ